MNTLGRRGVLAVGAVVGILVLVAGWFLLVSPVKSDIKKTKAATVEQTSENDSLRLTIASMRSIAKKLPQETAELAALNQRVPDQAELANLLRTITDTSTDTGVKLASLTPAQPIALASAPGISSVAINLNVTGGYAEIEQFDAALEALKRTFLVTSFSLTGGGAAPSSTTGTAATTDTTSAVSITAAFSGAVLVRTAAATATSTTGS